jgi:DNA-binding NarL/FixJ family response regulator
MRDGVAVGNLRRMAFRVLIVDDNESFIDAARVLLEREGLDVVGVASTSAEAFRLEEDHRPDVVLVDIMLGQESGFDLVRRLDANGRGRSAVILVSTHLEEDFADLIAASAAAGFLPKSELSAAAIHRILDRRSSS